jgi:four helix bundle protein
MGERIRYHTDLRVWQVSRALAVKVYTCTRSFPYEELHSLSNQIKRASASVPANIAEGCGRGTTRELVRSLRVARGSLSELHSHIMLAADLGYMQSSSAEDLQADIHEVHRMLNALIGSLQRRLAG